MVYNRTVVQNKFFKIVTLNYMIRFQLFALFKFLHFTDYETQDNDGEKESVVSVDTTALLHRLLPNSSPLSELQVCLFFLFYSQTKMIDLKILKIVHQVPVL